eukprot:1766723-Prymnesium_polylepis.1
MAPSPQRPAHQRASNTHRRRTVMHTPPRAAVAAPGYGVKASIKTTFLQQQGPQWRSALRHAKCCLAPTRAKCDLMLRKAASPSPTLCPALPTR